MKRGTFCTQLWPFETPAEDFGDFAPVLSLWAERRYNHAPHGLPPRKAFSFSDFRGWHGSVCISEFGDRQDDPRFRLFGSEVAMVLGKDCTGKYFSDLVRDDVYDQVMKPAFNALHEKPAILTGFGYTSVEFRNDVPFQGIELPLSSDGENVTGLLHFFRRMPEDAEWALPHGKPQAEFVLSGMRPPDRR